MSPTLGTNVLDWIKIALALEPALLPVAKDIASIFQRHPQLKPEDLASFVAMIHAGGDDLAAFIAADKQAHPVAG